MIVDSPAVALVIDGDAAGVGNSGAQRRELQPAGYQCWRVGAATVRIPVAGDAAPIPADRHRREFERRRHPRRNGMCAEPEVTPAKHVVAGRDAAAARGNRAKMNREDVEWRTRGTL